MQEQRDGKEKYVLENYTYGNKGNLILYTTEVVLCKTESTESLEKGEVLMEAKVQTKRSRVLGIGRVLSPLCAGVILLVLNGVGILSGIGYLLWPGSQMFWNLLGVVMLLAMFGNMIYANDNVQRWRRLHLGSKMLIRLSYGYNVCTILAMVGMMLGTLLISGHYSNLLADTIFLHLMVDISYFGLFLLGLMITTLRVWEELSSKKVRQKGWKKQQKLRSIAVWKGMTGCNAFLLLIVGAFVAYVIVFGGRFHLLEIMVPEFALYYAYIFLAAAFLLMQVTNAAKHPTFYRGTMVVGLVIFVVCLTPLLLIPSAIRGAENELVAAFGSDWRDRVEDAEDVFWQTPFVLPAYFLGIPSNDYIVYVDVPFYQGQEGVDEGVELRFDAYLPKERESNGPGRNATIIRIHGGAWMTGDKGFLNMMQMNKYFAAQGYTVFDVQYGLTTLSTFDMELAAPDRVKGAFTVDDMVRHIGIFLGYLAEHAEEYQANLDNVFITGGSAGGHLTAATGLGIASGQFTEVFGSTVKVKGIIPFYPANGIPQSGGITGVAEMLNPELLVDRQSPPALIFQGTHDSLVPRTVSQHFKEKYLHAENPHCALLEMPLAGHASDLNFGGYYNQVFLYYMERFMYLCQQS